MTANPDSRTKILSSPALAAVAAMVMCASAITLPGDANAAPQIQTQVIDYSFDLALNDTSTIASTGVFGGPGNPAISFNAFDANLGSLSSVSFNLTGMFDHGLSLSSGGPGQNVNYQMVTNPAFGSGIRGPSTGELQFDLPAGALPPPPVLTITTNFNDFWVPFVFIGTGQISTPFRALVASDGPGVFTGLAPDARVFGQLEVSYLYDGVPPPPPTPLPVSGAVFLILGGLAGLRVVRRQS